MGLKKIAMITVPVIIVIGTVIALYVGNNKIDDKVLKTALSIADEQIGAYSGKQAFDLSTLDETLYDKKKIVSNLETSVTNLKKLDNVVVDVGDFYKAFYSEEENNTEYDSLNLDFDPDEAKGEYYEEEPDFDKRILRGEEKDTMRVTDFTFSGSNFTDIVRYEGVNMVFERKDVPPTYLDYISNPDNLYTFSGYKVDNTNSTIDVDYISITSLQALTIRFTVEGGVIVDYTVL